jgi:hypothetical protein
MLYLLEARQQLRKMEISSLVEMLQEQAKLYDLVENSDYYHYCLREKEAKKEETPHLSLHTFALFYKSSFNYARDFFSSQESLFKAGKRVLARITAKDNKELTLEERILVAEFCLTCQYKLVKSVKAIELARAEPFKGFSNMSGLQQFKLKELFDELGGRKPKNFRETMRRYIPRWMYHNISIGNEWQEEMGEVWQDELLSEDGILYIKENEGVPLHMLFRMARNWEELGKDDLGYEMRIKGIRELMELELDRFSETSQFEIPFFHFTLVSLLCGEIDRKRKSAHFDYRAAVEETMRFTFQRLFSETFARSREWDKKRSSWVFGFFKRNIQNLLP